MTAMRALVCHQPCDWNELSIEDIAPPPMVPNGVRIAVAYASVSFAMSLQVAGKYQRAYPMPFTPGTEVAGTVLETGPDVTSVRPGERVLAIPDWGGLAEQVVMRAETVYPLPREHGTKLDLIPAIHLPNAYGTAYGALCWRARVAAGDTVLVTGAAGAVGVAAVELARHLGARVIAVASTPDKQAFAVAHGAHVAVGYAHLRDEVMAATDGRGVDVAIDMVGGDAFDAIIRTLRPFGRLVSVGFAGGRIPQAPANLLLVKNIAVLGHNMGLYYGWGPSDARARYEAQMRGMMRDLYDWTAAGALKPHVSHIVPLDDHREAMRLIREREARGKVVVAIGAAP
jgi:NADPH2:quinone reductase